MTVFSFNVIKLTLATKRQTLKIGMFSIQTQQVVLRVFILSI